MDFELWYLVAVPLLFAAGWFLRDLDSRQHKKETQGIDANYFKGLSLLLSDEPDKAIDLFIEVMRLDRETIELHHALGNLFRRRGQFDRAIRIHNFLVNRAELPETERALALSELALDYLKTGTYDRAESAYEALTHFVGREEEAHRALMQIYCTEKEWKKAISEAQQLQELGLDLHVEISHYYCELAQLSHDEERAQEYALAALTANHASPRAQALAADLALAAGDSGEAKRHWDELEKASIAYSPLIAAKKADVLAEENRESALEYLRNVFEKTGSVDVLYAIVARIAAWNGQDEATEFAASALHRRPSLSAFAVLCTMRQKSAPEDGEAKIIADITSRQARAASRYQCRHCGFLAHTFAWQCPGCERWDAFPPLRVDETKKASGGY